MTSKVISQSVLVEKTGAKVDFKTIAFDGKKITLKTKEKKEIVYENSNNISGFYDFENDIYLEQIYGFKERVLDGRLKLYKVNKVEEKYIPTATNPSFPNQVVNSNHIKTEKINWYLQKDGKPLSVFSNLRKKSKLYYFDEKLFRKFIYDDAEALAQFKKTKGKKNTVGAIKSIISHYNTNHFLRNPPKEIQKADSSTVFIFRGRKNQLKQILEISLNNEKYYFDKNEILELAIPNNTQSLMCIENGIEKTCRLIKSSDIYTKHFELSLDKDKNSSIVR